MAGSADAAAAQAGTEESRGDELARSLRVSVDSARLLIRAGYASPDAVRTLSPEELEKIGLPADERRALRPDASEPRAVSVAPRSGSKPAAPPAELDADRIVERWVGAVSRADKTRRPRLGTPTKRSTEVLKRWVDGDDRALEEWIRSGELEFGTAVPGPSAAPTAPPSAVSDAAATQTVLEREQTVVRWLTSLLDRVKSDQFDPAALLQEVQELHRHLYEERGRRRQLEEQIEHIKRGSIAVIKYVRSREAKGRESALRGKEEEIADLKLKLGTGAPAPGGDGGGSVRDLAPRPPEPNDKIPLVARSDEADARLRESFAERERMYVDREAELRRRIVQLEGDTRRLNNDLILMRHQADLSKGPSAALDAELTRRLSDVAEKERNLVSRENELRTKFEEIRLGAEENERKRAPIEFKEKELAAYDQQLQTRREALDLEARRLESVRRELGEGSVARTSEAQRLDDLRHEISKKEEELRGRESLLSERIKEAERIAGVAATAESERLHAESVADAKTSRTPSGVRRLDDLMYGGIPTGTQILLNGPAHTGRDTLARLFSIEGLRRKIPSIWVVTDKTFGQLRDDLTALYPGFAEAERAGLMRYVDLYSLAVGPTTNVPGVRFLSSSDKSVLDQLATTVNTFAEQLKEKFHGYRLIFETVSTVTAYLDTTATFRFLQPFIGRRKLDGAVSYYELESGMHTESDLETLEHMVDGSVNLKVEQMKTFLSIRGVGDVQARTWIGYTFTKRSFNLGSFSLEHIR